MFFRARRAVGRAWFNFNCRSVLQTRALEAKDQDLTLVSMICHGEVLMYLLAAKSFSQHLGRNPAVVILNDGSLTKEDCATLQSHIPQAKIVSIVDIATDGCPKGSCWERLFLIGDLVRESYVVQLDSDTLTLASIPEVNECIEGNRSFTLLGDRSYPKIETMVSACARSKDNHHPQVQAVCERTFDKLAEASSLKYLRGNAGFTGFAKGSFSREKIRYFSDLMRGLANDQWNEWGSEQVTSNLLIANSENSYPLEVPKYLSYWAHPEVPYERSSFIHFIGPHRFSHGFYLRSAKKAIGSLPRP